MVNGPVCQKPFDAPGESGKNSPKPLEGVFAGAFCRQVARPCRERPIDRIVDDEPAVDHVRKAVAQSLLAELGKQQPHEVVTPRQTAADIERAIQRLFHQARHLRFVGHLEPGIEIRLERKLTKQRKAERVDRADGDITRSFAHLAPQFPIGSVGIGTLTQLLQDAAAHFRRCLSGERNREDVGRARLPGSGD